MKFLDPSSEPVRRWVYGTAVSLVALALVFGWVTGEQSVAIGVVVAAALGIVPAEVARTKVSPANGSTADTSHDELTE
jgi:hypothetical protein